MMVKLIFHLKTWKITIQKLYMFYLEEIGANTQNIEIQ